MKNFGILVPVVTPCSHKGELDADGLRAVCSDLLKSRAIGSSVVGMFIGGSTGRGPWFNRQNLVKICRTVADHIGDKTPLAAGCMALGLPQMLDNARALADAGAQFAVITAPNYFVYHPKEIESIFLEFADSSPLPVMLYDIPGFARLKLDSEMIVSLARHGNIVGLKDSTGDWERFLKLLAAFRDAPGFYLFQGKERFLADSLLFGASGFVVSMMHINPRAFLLLYQAVRLGDRETALSIQGMINRVMDLVETSFQRRPETSTLFHFLNQVLQRRGICDNILLRHEVDCPPWLTENAVKAIEILSSTH